MHNVSKGHMSKLVVNLSTARELQENYGFTVPPVDQSFVEEEHKYWSVFPLAKWMCATIKPLNVAYLSTAQVTTLMMLPVKAWNAYLKAEFPDYKEE